MRIEEVPKKAWGVSPTPIPTKMVHDWEALLAILEKRNFIIIESDEIRITKNGTEECIPVKAFNAFVRNVKEKQLRTKRLSQTRWFCTL
jgi:hypothetical protein